ncbi:uncharacterized protein LOC107423074 [Ziziphus jujuba]|uniref:Uncharacterized protein LOC107423074 n=1 Tax=Ziziphus jujuba TaxID=326968 RepID=A0ABM3IPD2_ZIZJJ|nr:uncharacterized protein LOC107423074 [Ziziphus jujuba]
MGLKLETGKQSRKFDVVSIRTCCRSIYNHPFLVGMVFSLIFLYRSFPFLFSLLVYASPVLVCTAILLGTLLSFGQSNNIYEIEKQEYLSHGIDPLKPGVSESGIVVVNREESFEGKKSDTVEKSIEEASSIVNKVSKVEDVEDDHAPIKEVKTRESNGVVHEGKLRIEEVLHNEKADANQNSLVQENGSEILEVGVENYPRVSTKDQKEDHLDDHEDDDDDDDDSENRSMYSGSERAENSSVDGSTADMVPMLDETHPLLFREDPQPEIHGEEEDAGLDDNEDDDEEEEEEEAKEVKEDESKSAIKWTEDDQKNIMNLGTLELERNQCVENLIARRRAWQSSKTMSQKNLIDFESAEFPFSVSPLSVTRRNPFEFPHDSTNPGSAPSIMLPRRRNPFELPFESKEVKKEEKNDNKVDGFEQQSTTFDQKGIFFRRHESFSLGPSSLGFVKQANQDIKWRPVFIPERFVSEGTSYSSISRQSSGASDSKLSSIPDSESVSSVEQDFSKEKEMISNLYQTSNLVEHGSQSTEDVVSEEMVQIEKKDVEHIGLEITLGQVENHSEKEVENRSEKEVGNQSETESSLYETEEEDNDVEVENKTSGIHLETEPVEEEESSRSSLSSILEIDEKKSSHVQNDDGSSTKCLEANNGDHINGAVDENLPEEPLYDASPTAAGKSLSLISFFPDKQTEILENVKPPESEEMGAVVEEEKSEVYSEKDESSHPEKDWT